MRSDSKDVREYMESLPQDRAALIRSVRKIIMENLPDGYEEAMNWGMITYQVPLSTYPDTYNGQPLMYAALASQKNYCSLYLTAIYMNEEKRKEFERDFKDSGKKLNAGKSCVRFKTIEDLPLDVIGRTIASYASAEFVQEVKKIKSGSRSK